MLQKLCTKKLELFQDILVELPFVRYALQSKASISTTTSRLLQDCDPILPTKNMLLTRIILKTLRKRKMLHYAFGHAFDLVMLLIQSCFVPFGHASPDIFCSKDKNFEVLQLIPHVLGPKVKFIIHLSLFTVTIHYHYSPVTIYQCI